MTNFDMSRYDVKSILESSTLPIGGAAKRLKDVDQAEITVDHAAHRTTDDDNLSSQLTDGISNYHGNHGWPTLAFQQPFSMHYPYGQRVWCKQEQDSDPTNHGFQELHPHQFQSGNNNTHNFFQPNSVLHNLMGMDSTSMEHSSGSNNSVIYSSGGGHENGGVGYNGSSSTTTTGGYVIPMATVINSNENQNNHGNSGFGDNDQVKALGYENLFGATDPYHGRNLYYLSQQSAVGVVKASSAYDQGSACNNWVPTAVPALGPRSSNMAAVCHGAPTFTVWNDT